MDNLIARISYYKYDADKLVEARKAAGLSQTEVASRLKISSVHLCRVEKKQSASYELVVRLCEFYGIEPLSVLTHASSPIDDRPSRNNFRRKSTQCVESA